MRTVLRDYHAAILLMAFDILGVALEDSADWVFDDSDDNATLLDALNILKKVADGQ